jgi:hypothetical protein
VQAQTFQLAMSGSRVSEVNIVQSKTLTVDANWFPSTVVAADRAMHL